LKNANIFSNSKLHLINQRNRIPAGTANHSEEELIFQPDKKAGAH